MAERHAEIAPGQGIGEYESLCFDPDVVSFHMSTVGVDLPSLPGHLQPAEYVEHNIAMYNRQLVAIGRLPLAETAEQIFGQRHGRRDHLWAAQAVTASFHFDERVMADRQVPAHLRLTIARHLIAEVENAPGHITIGMRPTHTDPERAVQVHATTEFCRFDSTIHGRRYFVGDGTQPVTNFALTERIDETLEMLKVHSVRGNELLTMLGDHTLSLARVVEAEG